MGLFQRLKKGTGFLTSAAKNGLLIVSASVNGLVIPMDEIPDPVFSEGVLGICCAVDPVEGKVYAPVDGTISMLAETLHGVGIKSGNGMELLLHIGIDTVSLGGDGFTSKVREGQKVRKGELLMTMDMNKIKAAGCPAMVMHIITNSENYAEIKLSASGMVKAGDDLMRVAK